MAIYYIDPHTTTNGTGTWASPYSFASATRTTWASGDELRIKGVPLTSLLTATSYTATVTSQYQMTITAGGGLGADFVAGNIVYIPSIDTFFRVYSVATNVIQLYTASSLLPVKDWSITSYTIRKVDTTTYPVSATSSAYYTLGNAANINGVTISDCWTADGVRTSDGTAKSLINTSYTSAVTWYVDSSGTGANNLTYNLQNTHVMCGSGTSTGRISATFNASNTTYNINQIFSWYYASGGFTIGANGSPVFNTTINITYACNQPLVALAYGNNITINPTYYSNYYSDYYLFTSSGAGMAYTENSTVTLNTIIAYSTGTNSILVVTGSKSLTVNFNGVMDHFTSATLTNIMYATTGGPGVTILSFGAGFSYKYNKRVSTITSVSYRCYFTANSYSELVYFPEVSLPTGWTASIYYNVGVGLSTSNMLSYAGTKRPQQLTCSLPSAASLSPNSFIMSVMGVNSLIVYRNGDSPVEYLSPHGNSYTSNTLSTSYPQVFMDSVVYRTTGPSLEVYLQTRTAGMWTNNSTGIGARAYKTIKVPVTGGVSTTISGYIRTDETAFTNGDCRVRVYINETQVASQDMTTACENAWEQFTLTFTPSFTCEAILSLEMWYANGNRSYWLDDLTVT